MVTFECPLCTEPAAVDPASLSELVCEHCTISVEIAPDPVSPGRALAA